tara:strand:- start:275 stop:475 length:201 start_codon:yes stop_codon:yes gene_type:complete
MDTIKEIIYKDNKAFLEMIAKDMYNDSQEDIDLFIKKYHKKNFTYLSSSINDPKYRHKKIIKNALK